MNNIRLFNQALRLQARTGGSAADTINANSYQSTPTKLPVWGINQALFPPPQHFQSGSPRSDESRYNERNASMNHDRRLGQMNWQYSDSGDDSRRLTIQANSNGRSVFSTRDVQRFDERNAFVPPQNQMPPQYDSRNVIGGTQHGSHRQHHHQSHGATEGDYHHQHRHSHHRKPY
jgi:hypothetical protein